MSVTEVMKTPIKNTRERPDEDVSVSANVGTNLSTPDGSKIVIISDDLKTTNPTEKLKATTLVLGTRDVGCTCYYSKYNPRREERMTSPAGH